MNPCRGPMITPPHPSSSRRQRRPDYIRIDGLLDRRLSQHLSPRVSVRICLRVLGVRMCVRRPAANTAPLAAGGRNSGPRQEGGGGRRREGAGRDKPIDTLPSHKIHTCTHTQREHVQPRNKIDGISGAGRGRGRADYPMRAAP